MRESDFQAHLLRRLNAPNSGIRVWRQNAGQALAINGGGRMQLAPKGAGDLVGYVKPEGYHIEVEVKGPRTRVDDAQHRWADMLDRDGCVYVLVRSSTKLSDEENVAAAFSAVRNAVAARRARG